MSEFVKAAFQKISIDCDMDALAANQLRSIFENIAENDNRHVMVDLTRVNFMDSSGVGALIFLFKRLSAAGRKLALVEVGGQPADLLSQLQIDRITPVWLATADAIEIDPLFERTEI